MKQAAIGAYDVARFVAQSAQSREAFVRAAVSRYYFAAYLSAKNIEHWLNPKGTRENLGVHMKTITNFLDYTGPSKRLMNKIGEELRRFKNMRAHADYEFGRQLSSRSAMESEERAKRIMRLCQEAEHVLRAHAPTAPS